MKILKPTFILVCIGILCGFGCGRPEMTTAQASKLFENAGGLEKVNQEAKIIFERYGTNVSTVIYGQSLTNFPAISSLCSSVFLQTNSGSSTHIEIPFGTHYQRNFIFIFNSQGSIEFPYASNCIQVASNIFVGK
jgi:hypothetical protein